jgi:hypothetical protein
MKRILHDWDDAECRQILATLHRAAPPQGRVLVIEAVVPGPDTPHFAKLFDVHMLVWGTGRERTEEEYAALLAGGGGRTPPDVVPSVQDAGGRGGREGLGRTECWWGREPGVHKRAVLSCSGLAAGGISAVSQEVWWLMRVSVTG